MVFPCSNTRSGSVCSVDTLGSSSLVFLGGGGGTACNSVGTPGNLSLDFLGGGGGTACNSEEPFVLGGGFCSVGLVYLLATRLVADGLPCGLCEFFFLHLGLSGMSSSSPSLRAR